MDIELVYYNESNNSKIFVINSANKPVKLCFEGDELTESEYEDSLIRLIDNVKTNNAWQNEEYTVWVWR